MHPVRPLRRSSRAGHWLPLLALGVILIPLTIGCSKKSTTGPTPTSSRYKVGEFLASITGDPGVTGTSKSGSPPAASTGPSLTLTGNTGVVNGGANLLTARGASAIKTLYLFIQSVDGGVGDYYQVDLATANTVVTLVLTFARTIPVTNFDLSALGADSSGKVGAISKISTRVLPAGSGEVQVNVSWDTASDVDLHVVDPRGDEVYWSNTSVASGGKLDLDSNAGCSIDNKNSENINWPAGQAPSGTYTVRVDYWSSCGVASTNYVVRVNNGTRIDTYRGTFTGSGDSGGRGSGALITTFSHTAGAITGVTNGQEGAAPARTPRVIELGVRKPPRR